MNQEELNIKSCSEKNENIEYDIPLDLNYIQENIVNIDTEDLFKLKHDKNKFKSGIDSVSYICGQITALVNVGINPSEALLYISNMNTLDKATKNEKDLAKIQSDASIKCAKYESVTSQKNIL